MNNTFVGLCSITAMLLTLQTASAETKIVLDDADSGRVFEGIGVVSAGASTRNLVDYPGRQRSEVLDYMFKPKFGASLQHLKVEIGGGENSTCGSEPTHALTREELAKPVPRGYEFWLMAEARKRNPKILLDCLPWSYPYWVPNPWSQEAADWFVAFLDVAKDHYGLKTDWVAAAWNEHGTDLKWITKTLRPGNHQSAGWHLLAGCHFGDAR
jgi:galactosylceramidase